MEELIARISKHSGWNYTWSIKDNMMTIAQPGDDRSRVVLAVRDDMLVEVYGRLHHLGLTGWETIVVKEAIKRSLGTSASPTPLKMCNPFNIDELAV